MGSEELEKDFVGLSAVEDRAIVTILTRLKGCGVCHSVLAGLEDRCHNSHQSQRL